MQAAVQPQLLHQKLEALDVKQVAPALGAGGWGVQREARTPCALPRHPVDVALARARCKVGTVVKNCLPPTAVTLAQATPCLPLTGWSGRWGSAQRTRDPSPSTMRCRKKSRAAAGPAAAAMYASASKSMTKHSLTWGRSGVGGWGGNGHASLYACQLAHQATPGKVRLSGGAFPQGRGAQGQHAPCQNTHVKGSSGAVVSN